MLPAFAKAHAKGVLLGEQFSFWLDQFFLIGYCTAVARRPLFRLVASHVTILAGEALAAEFDQVVAAVQEGILAPGAVLAHDVAQCISTVVLESINVPDESMADSLRLAVWHGGIFAITEENVSAF